MLYFCKHQNSPCINESQWLCKKTQIAKKTSERVSLHEDVQSHCSSPASLAAQQMPSRRHQATTLQLQEAHAERTTYKKPKSTFQTQSHQFFLATGICLFQATLCAVSFLISYTPPFPIAPQSLAQQTTCEQPRGLLCFLIEQILSLHIQEINLMLYVISLLLLCHTRML